MKKLRIIMIDAFKPEYLKHAEYLSSLTKKFQWGELKMPLGHGGGMEILFKGKSNILATFYKKENSSLHWIKHFIWLEKFGQFGRFTIDCGINFFRFIRRQEFHRTGKIPLKKLFKFEMVDSKSFYKNLPIDYFYISDLDKVGHKYGTKSREIIEAVKKVDEKISKMKFDLILSDHGMKNVEKKIKVPFTENCFIDTDMARYWGNEEELKKIKKELPLKDGKIIDWSNKRFGKLIFIANSGIMISPNFWGDNNSKALHGYDGKDKDMKAFYILKKIGGEKNLNIKELHEILREQIQNGKSY